ncbi:MAG: hypothetical protein HN348_34165 [Proteobacteria bacterium]|jgi:hypothetical protein|nr:hypothetical protein [Pseudomonadota bacterium]
MEQHQILALVLSFVAVVDFLVMVVFAIKRGGLQGVFLGFAGFVSAMLMFGLAAGFYFQIIGLS